MYIFIAHKPETHNVYRGCTQNFYSSEFLSNHNLSEKDLIEVWSDIMYRNHIMKSDEDGFNVQIFCNGILNWKNDNGCYDVATQDIELENLLEEQARHIQEINLIYNKAYEMCLKNFNICGKGQ